MHRRPLQVCVGVLLNLIGGKDWGGVLVLIIIDGSVFLSVERYSGCLASSTWMGLSSSYGVKGLGWNDCFRGEVVELSFGAAEAGRGEEMRDAYSSLARKATSSVGVLRYSVVSPIKWLVKGLCD